jgi:aspartate 1-decarboxylase
LKVNLLKSKLHRATVTATALGYEGSVSLDRQLMRAAGLYEFEKVLIANVATGARFETYCLASDKPGVVCLNGAAARLAVIGDLVIIMAFTYVEASEAPNFKPQVALVDSQNRIINPRDPDLITV